MPNKPLQVLLVEDNAADVRMIEILLEEAAPRGFVLTHVERLKEALEHLRSPRQAFDAVLLDLTLPDAHELQALSETLAVAAQTPVIVVTGQDREEVAIQAVKSGAQDYLVKGQGDGYLLVRAIRYAIERKQANERLQYTSTHHLLTGLPNRTLFSTQIAHAIEKGGPHHGPFSVLSIDLDHFKVINDTLGHAVGDLLLVAAVQRLSSSLRRGDHLASLGGDEFVICLPETTADGQDLAKISHAILESFSRPFSLSGREIFITASIGVARYPHDGDQSEILIEHAGQAMSSAKENGRNNIQHFVSKMHDAAFLRLEIETGLRHAIARGELSLHYQPMTDIGLQEICGVEALLRWRRDNGTPVPTQTFIPMAEETGMIIPIGEWVLQTACAQNRAWRDAGLPPMRMSVNVSPAQLSHGDIVRTIQGALSASGMPPDSLEIEITEGAIMKDVEQAMPLIRQIHDMGVHISIDDFGTGYSSLNYLRRFWIDTLKIDQSFIREITSNLDDTSIVRAIITVAHSLDLNVVAEGIETRGQFYCLRSLGCNTIQGFLLSPPMPSSEMAAFLKTGWREKIETEADLPSGRANRRPAPVSPAGLPADPVKIAQ